MRPMVKQIKVKKEDSSFHGRNDELLSGWYYDLDVMEALRNHFSWEHNYYM